MLGFVYINNFTFIIYNMNAYLFAYFLIILHQLITLLVNLVL